MRKKTKKPIYIHYGDDSYNPEVVDKTLYGVLRSKPSKGVWASRFDGHSYSWIRWCRDSGYDATDFSKSFRFTLTNDARILYVHSEDDILPYVIKDTEYSFLYGRNKTSLCDRLNEDKLYRDYDGIELFISENYPELHNGIFNSWDCDSIVVWNPNVIQLRA